MKKRAKAIISITLCAAMLFSSVVGVSAAESDTKTDIKASVMEPVADFLSAAFNAVADALLSVIAEVLPSSVKVKNVSDYKSENFYEGSKEVIDEPSANARWSLGYSQSSIVPNDFSSGKYYKGGYSLNVKMTELLDDLKVRVIALDDGSDRGIHIFAVVDCIGLANSDVRLIRAALSDFAEQNNIASINVSATHVHSGIDTQGIYTDTIKSALKNLTSSIFGLDNLEPAIDTDFQNIIVNTTAACVKEAVNTMKTGELTYAHTDISDYVRDRTAPDISIDELYRLKFTPDDGSAGTIIANMGVHPESIGYAYDVATSDFVYYTEQVVNNAGFNFIFIQGAVGTITESMDKSSDGITENRIESVQRYGEELGYILLGMTLTEEECKATLVDYDRENKAADSENYTPWYENHVKEDEISVEPMLNVCLSECIVPIDNGVYQALGKLSLANNTMLKDGKDIYTVTEVGVMELGRDIKVILSPGETYAELIKGGENMNAFKYDCAYDVFGTEDVLVFDLMNDAVGYVMPDNYFTYATVRYKNGSITIDSSWGLTSLGVHAASDIYGEIYSLYDGRF